jgi:hypothetical protein
LEEIDCTEEEMLIFAALQVMGCLQFFLGWGKNFNLFWLKHSVCFSEERSEN